MKKLVVAALAAVIGPAAFGQNLLINGDFENGPLLATTFPGWTVSAGTIQILNFEPESGHQDAKYVNPISSTPDDIGMFQTVADTVGQSYTVSLEVWAFDPLWDPNNPLVMPGKVNTHFLWDGTTLFNGEPPNPGGDLNGPGSGWQNFTFTVTGTGSDTLYLMGNKSAGSIYLDNVSVTPTSAPEPASMALLGFGVIALIRRRRRSK